MFPQETSQNMPETVPNIPEHTLRNSLNKPLNRLFIDQCVHTYKKQYKTIEKQYTGIQIDVTLCKYHTLYKSIQEHVKHMKII